MMPDWRQGWQRKGNAIIDDGSGGGGGDVVVVVDRDEMVRRSKSSDLLTQQKSGSSTRLYESEKTKSYHTYPANDREPSLTTTKCCSPTGSVFTGLCVLTLDTVTNEGISIEIKHPMNLRWTYLQHGHYHAFL